MGGMHGHESGARVTVGFLAVIETVLQVVFLIK
jgi:hypothetical protein